MLAAYTFNSEYRPHPQPQAHLPNLRLLEGGKFSPRQFSPVLIQEYEHIRLRYFRWGLIPTWAKGQHAERPRFFLPADQVARQMGYQGLLQGQRCLIPADGYYIEHDQPKGRQTFKISHKQRDTFCFAGVFDSWQQADGSLRYTFGLLSTQAADSLQPYGLQMPLILPPAYEAAWLNPQTPWHKIDQILHRTLHTPVNIHPVHELKETPSSGRIEHAAA